MILDRSINTNLLVINDNVELPFYSYQEVLDFNTSLISYHFVIRIDPQEDFLVRLYNLFNGTQDFIKSIKIYDGIGTMIRNVEKDFTLDEAFVETFKDFEQGEFIQGNLKCSYKIIINENLQNTEG